MHIETNTKRTKNLVLLTTLDFMKSFWNHNNPTLDFIYPFIRMLLDRYKELHSSIVLHFHY